MLFLVLGIILLVDNITGQSLTLTSTVSGDLCDGESATFTCTTNGSNTVFNWYIFGLNGEGDIRETTARVLSDPPSGRFSTTDAAGGIPESNLMISNFTTADNEAVIYCSDALNPTLFSSTNITVGVGPFKLTKTSSSSGVNNISLSWDCVGSSCPPSEYLVKWSEIGMTEKQMITSTMAYTITGLNGCTSYSVTVEGEHRCGTSNFINVIPTMEGVPGPVPGDSEVNLRSFNESFSNLEILIKTQISRDDICDDTTINIEITVNSNGVTFSDTVEYMRSGQVYPTNIYLPVGRSFTAEICAVTTVGRGQCKMYEKASPPTATTVIAEGLSDAVIAGIGVGVALVCILVIVVVVCIVIGCYYYLKKKKSNQGSQERDQEGATHTKVDPDAKNKKQEGVQYADLKFDNSQPKPPPPQSKKEVEMVTYAVVDNTKKDKPEGNNE